MTNPNPFKPFTIEEFNQKIERAVDNVKNGRVTNTKQLKKEIKSWGLKPDNQKKAKDI